MSEKIHIGTKVTVEEYEALNTYCAERLLTKAFVIRFAVAALMRTDLDVPQLANLYGLGKALKYAVGRTRADSIPGGAGAVAVIPCPECESEDTLIQEDRVYCITCQVSSPLPPAAS